MLHSGEMPEKEPVANPVFFCPQCGRAVTDPLACGDCGALICRICGTPLESSEELAMG
jgi:hypothetical protein